MDEMLNELEQKIRTLLTQHEKLEWAHSQLQQGKSILSKEKESLLTKQKQAISYIETLVSKLKSIEKQL
jgi:uncharacterized protein (TIGR02449 family)